MTVALALDLDDLAWISPERAGSAQHLISKRVGGIQPRPIHP